MTASSVSLVDRETRSRHVHRTTLQVHWYDGHGVIYSIGFKIGLSSSRTRPTAISKRNEVSTGRSKSTLFHASLASSNRLTTGVEMHHNLSLKNPTGKVDVAWDTELCMGVKNGT